MYIFKGILVLHYVCLGEEMESHEDFNALVHTNSSKMHVKICREICDFPVIRSSHYKYNV